VSGVGPKEKRERTKKKKFPASAPESPVENGQLEKKKKRTQSFPGRIKVLFEEKDRKDANGRSHGREGSIRGVLVQPTYPRSGGMTKAPGLSLTNQLS